MNFKGYFKGLARVTRTFKLEIAGFRAEGIPAVLVAVGGVVLAAGVTRALAHSADRLPETLREARGLAQALRRDDAPQLPA
ncbi:MAG: hypothetical protein M3Y18_02465 [Candidatus Eremiobacteraeota bacterium]|nr:hypothetical protein [Candidatus Eremiobacteraeota bacterium]